MTDARFLSEAEMGVGSELSPSAVLCRAIIEDAEVARQFEIEPRSALEMLCVVMHGPMSVPCLSRPLPGEISRLIA